MLNTTTNEREVWAAVISVRLFKEDQYGHNICYKSMDETCGPVISNCPKKILDLLTPIDSEYANNWRGRCRDQLALRKMVELKPCDHIHFNEPVKFTSGNNSSDFYVEESKGRRVTLRMDSSTGMRCRLSRDFIVNAAKQGRIEIFHGDSNMPKLKSASFKP